MRTMLWIFAIYGWFRIACDVGKFCSLHEAERNRLRAAKKNREAEKNQEQRLRENGAWN